MAIRVPEWVARLQAKDGRGRDLVSAVGDWISDLAIGGFAMWTLLYQAARFFRWPTTPILVVWLVLLVALGIALIRAGRDDAGQHATATASAASDKPTKKARRARSVTPPEAAGAVSVDNGDDTAATPAPASTSQSQQRRLPSPRGLAVVAVVLAAGSALCAQNATGTLWTLAWALAAFSVAGAVVLITLYERGRRRVVEVVSDGASALSSAAVFVGAMLCAVASVFFERSDPDDAFYVNKAVYVAEHGQIPIHDTLYSHGTLPALTGAGSVPIQSIEVLQGAVGRLFGLSGGSVAYLVTPPIGTFLAVWGMWRLIRLWAPRRHFLALAVGVFFLLLAGQSGATPGVFFMARMQQGKVIYVAALLPMIYVYLTRWASSGRRRDLIWQFAIGVCAVGLTSSATFLVPVVCGAVAVGLLVTGRRWLGALAPAVYPLVTGAVVAITVPPGDPGGHFYSPEGAFHFVIGSHGFAALTWFAVLVAVWLGRRGIPRVALCAAAAGLVVVLAPSFLQIFKDVTGAGAVAWRLMWTAPIAVMVGMLAAVPTPLPQAVSARVRSVVRPAVALVPAAVTAIVLLVTGTWLWSPVRSVHVTSKPTWRYSPVALAQARLIVRRADAGGGPVLAPLSTMRALALTTSRVLAVDPRPSYLRVLEESKAHHDARLYLSRVMAGVWDVHAVKLRADLRVLRVTVVCTRPGQYQIRAALESGNWQVEPRSFHGLFCYAPAPRS